MSTNDDMEVKFHYNRLEDLVRRSA